MKRLFALIFVLSLVLVACADVSVVVQAEPTPPDAVPVTEESTPTSTPSPTWTATPTWTPTPTATLTWTPTSTPTPTATPTATPTMEPTPIPASPVLNFDVVVAGGGTGGFAASVQAARLGAEVLLIEETDWVGGQATAAGVSTMDAGLDVRTNPFGIYAEFVTRVKFYYDRLGKSIHTCYWGVDTVCFEPHIGQQVMLEMLEEAGVTIWLRTQVTAVLHSEGVIQGVHTTQGEVRTPVVVDATEWGDVLGLLPGSYRWLGEEIQDITWVAIVKFYLDGPPEELVMQEPPPGYDPGLFRDSVAREGHSEWPLRYPVSWTFHNAYRGLPDSSNPANYTAREGYITKTGVNWFNDYSITPAAVEDRGSRRQQICQAKLKTIQFLYYMQTIDPRWAVANDEGFNTPYNQAHVCFEQYRAIEVQMPLIPYVREARQMIGREVLLGKQIRRTEFPNAVAWGDYPIDLHGAQDKLDFGESWEDINPQEAGLFDIPTGVVISACYQGLLAAEKNISVSRLANGATRLQPVTMSTGQAAGVIAAFWPEVDIETIQNVLDDPTGRF